MTYVVILLAGALLIGALAWLHNHGAGGIPNPMAGWSVPSINALTREQWTLIVAPLLALVTILFVIPALFPGFTNRYHGPVWMLLFLLGLMALAAVIPYKLLRTAAFGGLGVLLLLSVMPPAWKALPEWTTSTPSSPVQTARIQTADECDNKYRIVTLTNTPRLIGNAVGCLAGWETREGAVILIYENGEESPPISVGANVGLTRRAIEWKAAGQSAKVLVRYYRS